MTGCLRVLVLRPPNAEKYDDSRVAINTGSIHCCGDSIVPLRLGEPLLMSNEALIYGRVSRRLVESKLWTKRKDSSCKMVLTLQMYSVRYTKTQRLQGIARRLIDHLSKPRLLRGLTASLDKYIYPSPLARLITSSNATINDVDGLYRFVPCKHKQGTRQHVDAFFPTLLIIIELTTPYTSHIYVYNATSGPFPFPIPQPRNAIRFLHLAAVPTTLKLASTMCDVIPTTRPQWMKALDELPATPEKIPAFFFAHGRTSSLFLGICHKCYLFVCISHRTIVDLAQGTTP